MFCLFSFLCFCLFCFVDFLVVVAVVVVLKCRHNLKASARIKNDKNVPEMKNYETENRKGVHQHVLNDFVFFGVPTRKNEW